MKAKSKLLLLLFLLIVASGITPAELKAQPGNVSFQVFYDQLSPFGQWINYPAYGYVWLPDAGPDFAPYSSGGHWIYTEYGWTWVSDFSWGWAPFHYGRWDFDNFYGWMWIPDNEWGPSWVTWRRGNGYYGWEPMAPGITVTISFGKPYNSHKDHWMFVRDRDFERTDLNHYYVNKNEHNIIIINSTVINKTYVDNKRRSTYATGPSREDVQKVTGRKINQISVQENNKPGQELNNGQLHLYRPIVVKNKSNGKSPIPVKVANMQNMKKYTERNTKSKSENIRPSNNGQKERAPISVKPSKNYETKSQTSKTYPVNSNRNDKQISPKKTSNAPKNNVVKTRPTQQQKVAPSGNKTIQSQPKKEQNNTGSNNNKNGRQSDNKKNERHPKDGKQENPRR